MTDIPHVAAATITDEQARAAVEVAVATAGTLGVRLAVVVVDAAGSPVATALMPGAAPKAAEAATAKATTAVLFGRATKSLARTTQPGTALLPAEGEADGKTAAFAPGGFPVRNSEGRTLGAVGVCGGTPEQDHAVAKAAAAS